MSKSNAFENDLLLLIFNATAIANIADNASSSPLTDLFVSAHTASPDEGGTQATNECTYGDYARVAVARSGSGWTVSGNSVSPAANINRIASIMRLPLIIARDIPHAKRGANLTGARHGPLP